jgi:hypothetical protein
MNIDRAAYYAAPRDDEPDDFDPAKLAELSDEDWLELFDPAWSEVHNNSGVLPPDSLPRSLWPEER